VISLAKSTRGDSIILHKNIKMKPLVEEINGNILANRIVGIISNPTKPAQSNTLANIGGSIVDFSKHVKSNTRNIQKKRDTEENIKFVY
jgi:hypothetical protein